MDAPRRGAVAGTASCAALAGEITGSDMATLAKSMAHSSSLQHRRGGESANDVQRALR
jgi:hypothetical protein